LKSYGIIIVDVVRQCIEIILIISNGNTFPDVKVRTALLVLQAESSFSIDIFSIHIECMRTALEMVG